MIVYTTLCIHVHVHCWNVLYHVLLFLCLMSSILPPIVHIILFVDLIEFYSLTMSSCTILKTSYMCANIIKDIRCLLYPLPNLYLNFVYLFWCTCINNNNNKTPNFHYIQLSIDAPMACSLIPTTHDATLSLTL